MKYKCLRYSHTLAWPPFVSHLEICNPICVKLLQIMSGVILSNLKKTMSLSQTVFLRSTNAAYTQTHTHDDSIRRIEMRCISPKNLLAMLIRYMSKLAYNHIYLSIQVEHKFNQFYMQQYTQMLYIALLRSNSIPRCCT